MKCTIFYSWQSDLPNPLNRGFIEQVLENAARRIRADDSIAIEPVIDRDTVGVPGSPDIAKTIFEKIEQSQVFVCDVSIINEAGQGRPSPNPNVLVELGFALKALGHDRVLMIANTAFGDLTLLPFDLRARRIIPYALSDGQVEKADVRKKLESQLEAMLRTMLKSIDIVSYTQDIDEATELFKQALIALENVQPTQGVAVRKYVNSLLKELSVIEPKSDQATEQMPVDELLYQAIVASSTLVSRFTMVSEVLAVANSEMAIDELTRMFADILDKYQPPPNISRGGYSRVEQDFYKFIGHELFVTLVAKLIGERKWELLKHLLDQSLYVRNTINGSPQLMNYGEVVQHVQWLDHRNQRMQTRWLSPHAQLLEERHREGSLASGMPMNDFIDAEVFLTMRSELDWFPISALYINNHIPRFLLEAKRVRFAEKLLKPLGVASVEDIKERVLQAKQTMEKQYSGRIAFYHGLRGFDVSEIASKQ